MPPGYRRLSDMMFRGYHSGFRWETIGYNTHDADGHKVHMYRFLLHNPHSTHLAKTLVRGTGSRSKGVIADCLSDIYNFAADNVHLCKHMEPQEFWAHAKNSWEWSSHFKDDAFWAFTYKLLHGRSLYLHTVPTRYHPDGHPLINALDRFRDAFHNLYGLDAILALNSDNNHSQESIEDVEDMVFMNKQVCEAYLQYTWADQEGDGTDNLVTRIVQDEHSDPNDGKYVRSTTIPAEFAEDNTDFYFDLGPRNPRYGHKNAYQEIEDAMEKAEKEELEAKQQKTTGLEEDIVMMGVGQAEEEEEDVHIDLGGLGI